MLLTCSHVHVHVIKIPDGDGGCAMELKESGLKEQGRTEIKAKESSRHCYFLGFTLCLVEILGQFNKELQDSSCPPICKREFSRV